VEAQDERLLAKEEIAMAIDSVRIDNNVLIIAQEDESLRATEYLVTVQHDDGHEDGFRFVVGYNGGISYVGRPQRLTDGVDIV
jgi:hypothetical protein